jgi:hypothetical protein
VSLVPVGGVLLALNLDDAWEDVWFTIALFGVSRRPKALRLSRWHTCVARLPACDHLTTPPMQMHGVLALCGLGYAL